MPPNVLLWRLRTIFAASSARFILIGFDTHILIEELRASNRGNNCENAKLGTSKNTTNIIESFLWRLLLLNIYHALLHMTYKLGELFKYLTSFLFCNSTWK